MQIDQHRQNPNEMVVLYKGYGILKSLVFGATYMLMNSFFGYYHYWLVGYKANDLQNIMCWEEEIFFDPISSQRSMGVVHGKK